MNWVSRLERMRRECDEIEAEVAAAGLEPNLDVALLLETADALVEWDLTWGSRNARARQARVWAHELAAQLRRLVEYPRPEPEP